MLVPEGGRQGTCWGSSGGAHTLSALAPAAALEVCVNVMPDSRSPGSTAGTHP